MCNKIITINVKPVGNACNIHCRYCDSERSSNMHLLHKQTYASHLRTLSSQYDFVHVILHGGEPLLASADYLEEIFEITNIELDKKCDFQLQTNGTLLTDKKIQFLQKKNCKLSVSFDPINENLRYDKEMYEHVKNNIVHAIAMGSTPGVISVVHQKNLPYIVPFMQDLMDMKVQYWTINKIRADKSSPHFITENEYLTLLWDILQAWIEKKGYNTLSIQPLLDLLSPGKNHSCHFCSLNDKCSHFCSILSDALIPFCEHYHGENKRLYKCEECKLYCICGGGCPTDNPDDEFCNSRRLFFEKLEHFKKQMGMI